MQLNSSSISSDSSSSDDDSEQQQVLTEHAHNQNRGDDDDDVSPVQHQMQQWTRNIPIGLGLCPWAVKSYNKGLLRYVTCNSETPQDVALCVQREAQRFDTSCHEPPWSTTLVICPYVKEWNESFPMFDRFVSKDIWDEISSSRQNNNDDKDQNPSLLTEKIQDQITLVAFHPNFLRWHSLPDGVTVGSTVQSHYGMIGQKSIETLPATIVETCNKAFGMRRVKVRFHDIEGANDTGDDACACGNNRRKEQYVPTNWIYATQNNDNRDSGDDERERESSTAPLPDNAMHQAIFPTIHIIANSDLANLSIRDISRVKRKNAQRMMKLGWDGVQRCLMSENKN